MKENDDIFLWKFGQMSRSRAYSAVAKGRGGVSWKFTDLVSATVEFAAPTDVVLTFPAANTELGDTDFTIAGRTISSASWAGAVLTLVMSTAFIAGDTQLVVTFVGTGDTANVTDNVTESELTTYITGLSTPLSDAQKTKVNTFINSLKAGLTITNLSDAFDFMYILAGETSESSLRNLVKNAHHAQAVTSPTFNAFEGFTGDGSSSYIDSKYEFNANKVAASINSLSFGIYLRTNADGNMADMGVSDANNERTYIFSRLSNTLYYTNALKGNINQDVANTDSRGLIISSRTANNLTTAYKNGLSLETDNQVSDSVYNKNIYILARQEGITGAKQHSTRQASFAFFGRGLSQADVTALTNAFEAYMDSNGKGVIA